MAATIKLMRFGKKNYPTYRIIVVDKRKKRNGRYIENIGTYNPMTNPETIQINKERMEYWMKVGAQISEGIQKLMKSKIYHSQT